MYVVFCIVRTLQYETVRMLLIITKDDGEFYSSAKKTVVKHLTKVYRHLYTVLVNN